MRPQPNAAYLFMMYVLPGMGANHAMYPGPWRELAETTFIDWPAYRGETTVRQMAERIVDERGIKDGALIVGSSFGGMVGCELAKLVAVRGIVLIGSAKQKEEVRHLLGWLLPLVDYAPLDLVRRAAGKMPGEMAQVLASADGPLIRAMSKAIFTWDGCDDSRGVPVRIHGRRDMVIPCPPAVDLEIDGGHMIAMTHADECVSFIRKRFQVPTAARSKP